MPIAPRPSARGRVSSRGTPPPTLSTLLQHCNPSLQAKSREQPCHTFPRRMGMTSSSVQAAARGAGIEGRAKVGLPQKRPFEGSLLPPFQARSFHYLSAHPAPGDLQFRDTHSHLLLRKPQGQEAGHHPGEQTDIQKRTGEGKAESVGRRHRARRLVQRARAAPGSFRGGTGEENRAEEMIEGSGAPEPASPAKAVLALGRVPARQGCKPHLTLAPRPSWCRMEYFMK